MELADKNRQMYCHYPLVIPKKISSGEGSSTQYGLGLGKSNTEIPTFGADGSQRYQDKKKHHCFCCEHFRPEFFGERTVNLNSSRIDMR